MKVTSEADVRAAIALTKASFGRLDFVVNCAGIGLGCQTYDFETDTAHSLDEFQRVMTVCYRFLV